MYKFLQFVVPLVLFASCSLGGNLGELQDSLGNTDHPEIITGNPRVGETLEADVSPLGGTGIVNYQWKRGGTSIGTAPTYTVKFADKGATITVTLTRSGSQDSVTSAPVGPVPTPSVTISGNAEVGQQLTPGTGNLGGTISFEWNGAGSVVTGSPYTVQPADSDSDITVTAFVSGDNTGSVTSAPTRIALYSSMGISLVRIQSGTFAMGSPGTELGRYDDETQHPVILSDGFYMGIYPVTQDQYEAVMGTGTNPSHFIAGPDTGEVQGRRPVETVSWFDAIVFCNKLSEKEHLNPAYEIQESSADAGSWTIDTTKWGEVPDSTSHANFARWNGVRMVSGATGYRLPSEAQWEYACRAGTVTMYSFGNDAALLGQYAWYGSNSGIKTHEVGKKLPNAWGLYDMHGNIWEWCWDWYGLYNSSSQPDPQGPSVGSDRIRRGGCWYNTNINVRSALRDADDPSGKDNNIGFRVMHY